MRVSFLDFWDGFIDNNNFLYYFFKQIHGEVNIVDPVKADLIIFSVFGNENLKYNHCPKLFFTGENRRPDFNVCDFSISFDLDDYDGRNIRIPLWYYYIDWFNVGSYNNPNYLIPIEFLDHPNPFSMKEKKLFCSAVYSNPIPMRNYFVQILNQIDKVDCFGKLYGFNKLLDGELNKMEIISNYKFNLCFENNNYPGYHTEKLLHAKVAGCIPIYSSEDYIGLDFNPDCFINVKTYGSSEELIEHLKLILYNSKEYLEIVEKPIFEIKPDLSEIQKKLNKIWSK